MKNFLHIFIRVLVSTSVAGICAIAVIVLYTNAQLPTVNVLEEIQLQVPLKIYTADGKLIGEYGEKRRTPIAIKDVPETLKNAILATEDRRFYDHNGVDLRGMARATLHLVVSGTKAQGASTITMQVARNFFLTRKKTFGRKLNEVLLAIKIEKELSKDQILELYLNKIYFGKRAYGVQAAAQVYYGTTVDKLDLAQIAMIAGLPQAPSAINPINNPEAATKRRAHVLKRMLHYGFINEAEYEEAQTKPVVTSYHGRVVDMDAPHVAEMARKELLEKFGPDIYTSGFVAYTTVDSRLQTIAHHAVQEGLLEYDKRHGYRGAVAQLTVSDDGIINKEQWAEQLRAYPKTSFTLPAAVLSVGDNSIQAILPNHQQITISFDSMRWASRQLSRSRNGPPPQHPSEVVSTGDVIYVEPGNNVWLFSQLPDVEGALVAMHPKNGALLAMIGGFDFNLSHFNRATQATRQPGSNFKPFVYAAALEHGFTAATIINDAPVVYKDNMDEAWRPQNDTRRFYGPTRLRVGLTKSRNLVSIRLLQSLGIGRALKVIERFGFSRQNLPRSLSLALGTAAASPLDICTGYAAFANGGYKVKPFIVQKVTDSQDKIVYEANPPTACPECQRLVEQDVSPFEQEENTINQLVKEQNSQTTVPATQIITPQTAYIMTSILQDAIQTGTGKLARALNRSDLAGKTGTTNNQMDAWYTGYNQSLVASVWVGYDDPRSVEEYGSQAALPIWMKFMGPALQGVPETKPEQPRGLVTVKIDPATGLLARPGQGNAIFEVFRQETAPSRAAAHYGGERNAITPSSGSGETLF
ncbi:MAG: penicillin-binding protein 1A [Gammaproteobacteria bacterium]|jgi:penicillin-binding protein 1A|nr:penicillin-binding protein 1A [Gammaproteobacteria bacterium]